MASDWVALCNFVRDADNQAELNAAITADESLRLEAPVWQDLMQAIGESVANDQQAWIRRSGNRTLVVSEAPSFSWRILGVLEEGNDRVVLQKGHLYYASPATTKVVRALSGVLKPAVSASAQDQWLAWFETP